MEPKTRTGAGKAGKPIRGTREWAVANIDCCTGCSHDCRYCYARYDSVVRRGELTAAEWQKCVVRQKDVAAAQKLYDGQVMFPTTHDIVPENLAACIVVISNLCQAGNRVLVVSKPHLECVRELCKELELYRQQILFRFTITARDSELLSYWEPGAPDYDERRQCLCYAFGKGFVTSVSVEPMLDSRDVVPMVLELLPCVNHSIWLGKMNRIEKRVAIESERDQLMVDRIRAGQTDERVRAIYAALGKEPLVRWKESMKKVLGLDLAGEPGLDV